MFYIDASTRETISAGLIALAKAANAGETSEEATVWLVSREERWLLILNNADDPKLNLQEFFPACKHGDILITTRNQQMRAHTQEPKSYCNVAAMLLEDALALMLKASGVAGDRYEVEIANTLIKVRLRIKSLFKIVLSGYFRNLSTLRLQSCNQAHTCAQLSAGWSSITSSSRQRETNYSESVEPSRQMTTDYHCSPPGRLATASSPLMPRSYCT